jgi:hypothetical protein
MLIIGNVVYNPRRRSSAGFAGAILGEVRKGGVPPSEDND